MLKLLWNVVVGSLILTKYNGKSEVKNILLLKWCGSDYPGYNISILGIVLGINNNHFDIKFQRNNNNGVFNSIISVRNINKLQFGTDIKYHDVVKLVLDTINIF